MSRLSLKLSRFPPPLPPNTIAHGYLGTVVDNNNNNNNNMYLKSSIQTSSIDYI